MEHTEIVLWALTAARFLYVIRKKEWVGQQQEPGLDSGS